jgi:hypothetical protein
MKTFFHRWGNVLALLGILTGVAFAQTINQSVQLSQDPRGTIGVDTNGNIYLQQNKHFLSTPNVAPPPVASSCGTSPSIVGTDFSGKVTTGSGATTSCVVTFGTAFLTAPACLVSADSTTALTAALRGVSTTTTLTVTYASSTSGLFDYICASTS